eukprot:6470759-Amphidinium_carterae.1
MLFRSTRLPYMWSLVVARQQRIHIREDGPPMVEHGGYGIRQSSALLLPVNLVILVPLCQGRRNAKRIEIVRQRMLKP